MDALVLRGRDQTDDVLALTPYGLSERLDVRDVNWNPGFTTDLESFFDRVNHDVLMERLSRKINDKALLRLIRRFLRAGLMADGVVPCRRSS